MNVFDSRRCSSLPHLRRLVPAKVRTGWFIPPAGPRRLWPLVTLLALLGALCGTSGRQGICPAQTAPGAAPPPTPGQATRTLRQDATQQIPEPNEPANGPLSKKQKQGLLKDNFVKMKREADELADLAKALQEDLSKSNENVLSLKVVDKAEKIEKLAKKIKGSARGY